ncbi:cupin domain-containing protein [Haliscomenobacter hydrossis]|uniref:Cupin 2 conserved barrel domain protein n=1 Tax=Haliscomenobacter hydrossis (strain ATCC 27775 / DSM 1100 / LMG 10767 / O) TaxID=760192 RepID=F4L3C6_HALH1|nr:cupin domain-containing protein [Haliscomenobacter hydrossis]AEE51760.1 Cupin 2 conserved barrel domain protein [Haliscomenobacter hydrossis DSM 1100]
MTSVQTARTVVNPVIKDKATFVEIAAETGGRRTFIEIELAPGGGNGLHYHKSFAETFTVLQGTLGVQMGKQIHHLQPGQSATVEPMVVHRFFNVSQAEPVMFSVELRPGHAGFERCVQVVYGLAADQQTDQKNGIPKNIYHLALILKWGDTQMPGFFKLLQPLFGWLAKRAERKGIDQQLIEKYCKF